MKKKLAKLMAAVLGLTMAIGLTACGGAGEATEAGEGAGEAITITFMNGEETLGTVDGTAGEVISGYENYENLDGYEFAGWFETPTYLEASAVDPATATFEESTTLYGQFKSTDITEDTNLWYIVGTSSSGPLAVTNWAADISDEEKAEFELVKAEDSNTFTLAIDLYNGDQFQLIPNWGWDGQLGWGYVTECDETQVENGGGLSGSTSTSNINVLMDGNYTITLTTNPDDKKQNTISIVRNGDTVGIAAEAASEEEPYEITDATGVKVKGSWVSDWSELKDLENKGDGIYQITMDLDAGIELYFSIFEGDNDTGLGLKGANVADDASKALLADSDNVKVNEAGTYTFTVDLAANTVAVTQ